MPAKGIDGCKGMEDAFGGHWPSLAVAGGTEIEASDKSGLHVGECVLSHIGHNTVAALSSRTW